MEDDNFKFVMVGHVDHGKSTIIGRLLHETDSLEDGKVEEIKQICEALGKDFEYGYILDHFEEERKQGVTIDTTQIFFRTEQREYTIIDAPGHVEFVRNMITGASQAEAAVLIVDAEEGVQEQTKRHSYILSMLGLDQVIVLINKMDLVDYEEERFEEVKEDTIDFLDGLEIKPNYVIPVSAKEGDYLAEKTPNLDWFDGPTFLEALDSFEHVKLPKDKDMMFAVQDVYNWDKRITAGRVEAGIMKQGMKIKINPSGETTKIKTLEEFQRDPKEAEAGKSIGFTTEDKVFLDRGDVVTSEDKEVLVTDKVRGHIFWLDKKPLKKEERLLLKCGTQEVKCGIENIERVIDSSTLEQLDKDDDIKYREVADIVLKTSEPIVIEDFNDVPEFGRFVLNRDDTVAGGIITEVEK